MSALCARPRLRLPDASEDVLHFAQVREDPELEIRALELGPNDHAVVVGSGGCTVLSILAATGARVAAVDVNPVQNHVLELKLAAVCELGREQAVGFLGGWPMVPADRLATYHRIRPVLSDAARSWWDAGQGAVEGGAIEAGRTERYLRGAARVLRRLVHGEDRIGRLLACGTVEEQRAFYVSDWNNRRWRTLLALLGGRAALRRVYRPDFFRHADGARYSGHFRDRLEHTLTALPVARNYFLHQLLTGRYPDDPAALPRYLAAPGLEGAEERLQIVDGGFAAYLRTLPEDSVDGFALSNICEWMAPPEVDALFSEVHRTARDGARVVVRNFVGWTEVPERWSDRILEDRGAGETLMAWDRSLFQRRFAPCRVRKAAA